MFARPARRLRAFLARGGRRRARARRRRSVARGDGRARRSRDRVGGILCPRGMSSVDAREARSALERRWEELGRGPESEEALRRVSRAKARERRCGERARAETIARGRRDGDVGVD